MDFVIRFPLICCKLLIMGLLNYLQGLKMRKNANNVEIYICQYVYMFTFYFFQILILLQKTNSDWWQIRKSDATEGFVPANYIKEVDPKIVQKVIKRPIRVPETVKVNERLIQKEPLRENGKQPGLHRAPSGIDFTLFV